MAEGTPTRTVAEVMSAPPVTSVPSETLADASSRMRDRGVGSVIVVDGERPIGILTERDLVRFAASGADASGTKVSRMDDRRPGSRSAPTSFVQEAFASLASHGYRHIPVVEGDRLVGVVSMRDLMKVAQIQPVVHPSTIEAPPGLEGVIVAETSVGDVRGLQGFYHYRQYNAVELADKRPLEDVWRLLFDGRLADARRTRGIPSRDRSAAPHPRLGADPSCQRSRRRRRRSWKDCALRCRSSARRKASRPTLDIPADERRANALQLCAVTPTLIMALHRHEQGLEPIEPRDDLGYGANYLWMLTGEEADPDIARAVEQYQITTIDHGFNASTFTARVIVSTGADVGAAVVGAIGALSGPLHGGAPSRALDLLDAIGTPDNARPYLVDAGRNAASASWASVTASTRPTTRARSSSGASPSGSERRRSSSPSRSSRPWSRCWPS